MAQKQLATKIDAEVKDSLDKVLDRLGIKLGRFIESAIWRISLIAAQNLIAAWTRSSKD